MTHVRHLGWLAHPQLAARPPPDLPRHDAGGRRPGRRTLVGTLLLPSWSRAPLLAFGEPVVLLAVFAATAILACASASAPLLLTSTASASVQQQIVAECPDASWPSVTVSSYPSAGAATRDARVPDAITGVGLARPELNMSVPGAVDLDTAAGRSFVQLFYRDRAVDNVTVVESVDRQGVLLPVSAAEIAGVGAGDTVTVLGSAVVVAGVYTDLDRAPTTEFWCSYEALFRFIPTIAAPLPLLIATDPTTVYRLTSNAPDNDPSNFLRQPVTRTWVSPIETANLTRTEAVDIIARQEAALGAAVRGTDQQIAGNETLSGFLARTERVQSGLVGPVVPIALTGAVIALGLVAAAGWFWADRRRREVRLLSSRGVGPGALGLKAGLELLVPVLGGTIAGFYLARGMVMLLGPSNDLEPAAVQLAVVTVGAGLVIGLTLLGLVAGLRARNTTERPSADALVRWPARVPLEVIPLAAAVYCWVRLRGTDPVVSEAGVAKLNLLVVAMPLLFLLGAAPLVIRGLIAALPMLRRRASARSPATFLAANRMSANRGISALVMSAVAIPTGVFGYAVTITATTQQTFEATAQVFVGSDLAVSTFDDAVPTPALDQISTRVLRYQDVTVRDVSVQVIAIDLDTFAGTAYWDDRFADRPLRELLDLLRGPDPLPALAVGLPTGEQQLSFGSDQTVTVSVAATPMVFPGTHVSAPLVIVDADRLGAIETGADLRTEFWTRGATAPVLEQLASQQIRVFTVFDRDRVFLVANFLGVSFTFGFLAALAAFIAVIGIASLLLYVETRQRSRTAAYILARRMGLTRKQHATAIRRELSVLLGAGVFVGTVLAAVAVSVTYRRLDVDRLRPPAQLLTLPLWSYLFVLVGSAAVCLAVSGYAQRVTDRADDSTVMRGI